MQKEIFIENTRIVINDLLCREQTEEECQKILERVSSIAYEALINQIRSRMENNKATA